MKSFIAFIIAILLTILSIPCLYADASVPPAVMDAVDSVVRIQANYTDGTSTGTGFIVSNHGQNTYIATNAHVVEGDPYEIEIWIGDNESVRANIYVTATQKDLCLLKLDYPIDANALKLSGSTAKQGEGVYAVGFPAAADYLSDIEAHSAKDATITDGIVSAIRETTITEYGTPVTLLQINAAINAGNSGGPLFNTKGEVIGINTYGITDAQGIFGSIAAEELIVLLEDSEIDVAADTRIPVIGILSATASIIVLIVVVFLLIRKRRKGMQRPMRNAVKLSEYMELYPNGMSAQQAATMLEPIARQVADMHSANKLHLQISPETIVVRSNGTVLLSPSANGNDRYANGFAAPEIYTDGNVDARADLYSLCAVLYFMATGRKPENSLTRKSDALSADITDDTLSSILSAGMALNADDRTADMQSICKKLHLLALYHIGTTTQVSIPAASTQPAKAKGRFSKGFRVWAAILLVILMLGAAACSYWLTYTKCKDLAAAHDFAEADRWLWFPQAIALHDADLIRYIEAGILLENRKYDEALTALETLQSAYDSDMLITEAKMRKAAALVSNNQFDDAIAIYTELKEAGDSEAESKIPETRFLKGQYLLYELEEYDLAIQMFTYLLSIDYPYAKEMYEETCYLWALHHATNEDYISAFDKAQEIAYTASGKELMALIREGLYYKGQSFYRRADYKNATECFNRIESYQDSAAYLNLIQAKEIVQIANGGGYLSTHNIMSVLHKRDYEKIASTLLAHYDLEDTPSIMLIYKTFAKAFLQGSWSSYDGEYYFDMGSDGRISYNLPFFNYGDYYTIINGALMLYDEDDAAMHNAKTLFEFTIVDFNCIKVFCHKNNKTYTLYRQ